MLKTSGSVTKAHGRRFSMNIVTEKQTLMQYRKRIEDGLKTKKDGKATRTQKEEPP